MQLINTGESKEEHKMSQEKIEFVEPSVEVQKLTVIENLTVSGDNNWDLPEL